MPSQTKLVGKDGILPYSSPKTYRAHMKYLIDTGYVIEEKDRYIDVELQKKLHDLYVGIARENQGVVISTTLSEDVCFERILLEVQKVVGA